MTLRSQLLCHLFDCYPHPRILKISLENCWLTLCASVLVWADKALSLGCVVVFFQTAPQTSPLRLAPKSNVDARLMSYGN